MALSDLINKYQPKLEENARRLCQEGQCETGHGTCALICLDQLQPRAHGCPHALRVFEKQIRPGLRRGAVMALNACLKSN